MIAPQSLSDHLDLAWADWECTDPLPLQAYRSVVEEMGLTGCKWDLQVGDTAALAPFAITVSRSSYRALCMLAQQLSRELNEMERVIATMPHLWPKLGLPSRVRRVLDRDLPWTPAAARVIRYDFHPTRDGWRISEANSDVPGGFNEASTFSVLVAQHLRGLKPTGDPLADFAQALSAAAGPKGCVGIVAAPGYREDQQVVSGVAFALAKKRTNAVIITPEQLRWDSGHAYAQLGTVRHDFAVVYRFFQGEWSARVASQDWGFVFRGGKTPVCNPAVAILTESKRLPLVWESLELDVPVWRSLLPPVAVSWRAIATSSRWVFKDPYSNNGEAVFSSAWSGRRFQPWLRALSCGQRSVAQRRFEPLPIITPHGPMFPCIGVFTIDGEPTGVYGRISPHPVIDYTAQDVPVLIRL